MILVLVASFFCILNIVLWGVIFTKFKKIFSTDDIIATTRQELEQMLKDVNRTTGRNLDLIEAKIKEIKAVVSESERRLSVMRNDLEKQRATARVQQQIDNRIHHDAGTFSKSVADRYKRNARSPVQNFGAGLRADESYSVTTEGRRHVSQQGDLFDQVYDQEDDKNQVISPAGTFFSVESDGSSVASVPVLGPNISYADNPIVPQKSFEERVKELYYQGHSLEEIAVELNSSTTEVGFVINMDV